MQENSTTTWPRVIWKEQISLRTTQVTDQGNHKVSGIVTSPIKVNVMNDAYGERGKCTNALGYTCTVHYRLLKGKQNQKRSVESSYVLQECNTFRFLACGAEMARDFYDNSASADVDDARRDVEHDDT